MICQSDEGGRRQRGNERRRWTSIWMTRKSTTSLSPSMSWWCGQCWWRGRRWHFSSGSMERRPWPRRWWHASCARPWLTKPPRMTWWTISLRSSIITPGAWVNLHGQTILAWWFIVPFPDVSQLDVAALFIAFHCNPYLLNGYSLAPQRML